jgi:hypothetical protein
MRIGFLKNHRDSADFISDERTYFWMKYDI